MKIIRFVLILLTGMICSNIIICQETFPRNDVLDKRMEAYAFTNASIVIDHETTISDATLLIKEGKIQNTGQGIVIPDGYNIVDLKGKFIYPSFIDLHSNYGIPKPERRRGGG